MSFPRKGSPEPADRRPGDATAGVNSPGRCLNVRKGQLGRQNEMALKYV